MRSARYILLVLFLVLFASVDATSNITLPRLISNGVVLQRNTPIPVWGWASAGESVTLSFNGNTYTTTTNANGKWEVSIPAMPAGGPYTMIIAGVNNTITLTDILVGDVYFCSGQSNMAHVISTSASLYANEIATSSNSNIRHFKVSRTYSSTLQEDVSSVNGWQSANPTTVLNFTAVGYFFARDIYARYNIPVGLINSSYEGTPAQAWMSTDGLSNFPNYLSQVHNTSNPEWDPMVLYKAMVYPFLKQPLKGILWYQGESNRLKSYEYRQLFPALINDWRAKFNQGDIPFLFVQLANYLTVRSEPQQSNVAECREAQGMALYLPKTAMAVIHDTNTDTITHPLNKKTVGLRLSLAAQNIIYGETTVLYKSPSFNAAAINGNKISISFRDAGTGLTIQGGALQGFTIAGADRRFVNATATLVGNVVEVSSLEIMKPVAVRYAWADNPITANLYSNEDLPVNSFRTDNWSGLTYLVSSTPSSLTTPFIPGNLVVYRYSTGDATKALSGSTVPVYIDEFSTIPTASPVKSLALPTVTNGTNFRITGLPKTGSPLAYAPEGMPALSANGQYLTLFGYDQSVGAFSTGSVNRVIARIDANGNINSSTTVESALGQPRCAIAEGNNFWVAGNATGIRLTSLGATTTTTQVATSPGASRSLGLFSNKLYCFIGDGKLYNFNNLPQTTSTVNSTASLANAAGNNQSVLFDTNGDGTADLMYMADDGLVATPQNAALRKYVLVNGSWVAKGSITATDTAIVHGLKSITGRAVNGSVELYAVTWGNQTNFAPSMLFKLQDGNAASSSLSITTHKPEILAVADTNSMFRGVTFTPGTTVNVVLPLNDIRLFAITSASGIKLKWSVTDENAITRYELQWSYDGITFQTISSQTSNNARNYSWIDRDHNSKTNYYRIIIHKIDGGETISNIVVVNGNELSSVKLFQVSSNLIILEANISAAANGFITVTDVQGRIIVRQDQKMSIGKNNIEILLPGAISAGMYVMNIVIGDDKISKKIMIR